MVVSIDIYAISSMIELIALLIFGIFVFVKREETLSRIMRLITSSILLIINVFQIPMEIQIGRSYTLTIIFIFIYFADAIYNAYVLGKDF